ncbi:hypothetical protein EDC01DRAFT_620835 [Geopyxis carbonaria]|nr:hypothetical protein EDC01DRAFT_620835 [Geopyxis carbonaria]
MARDPDNHEDDRREHNTHHRNSSQKNRERRPSRTAPPAPNATKTTATNTKNIIYTPASTISSSKDSTCEEALAEQPNQEEAVWGEWWRAEALAAQVGSLSKELGELKKMIAKQSIDEEANDLSRLKQNHRSSLASLAELHRTEIAGLNATQTEAIRKLELTHMEDLKDARRNNGHDRELVKGLHESYGKQIESLVMDLGEAKREIKELRLKQGAVPVPASEAIALPVDPTPDDVSCRTLTMSVTFDKLEGPLSVAEFSLPHPGQSFTALLWLLSFTVQNHLQTLNTTANFFLSRPTKEEHVDAATKIKHFNKCTIARNIHFKFPLTENVGSTMKEYWQSGQWKNDEFVLDVICTAEGWENMEPLAPIEDRDDATVIERLQEAEGSPLGHISVGSSRQSSIFDPVADLDRINKDLDHLNTHQPLPSDADTDNILPSEEDNKENNEPSSSTAKNTKRVTVQDVPDEDDPRVLVSPIKSPTVTTKAPSMPSKKRSAQSLPMIWEDEPGRSRQTGTPDPKTSERLSEYLENEVRKSQAGPKGPKSSDSWLFDEIFAALPVPSDKGKGKDVDNVPQSFIDPLIGKDEEVGGGRPASGWRWMLTSDGVVKTPPSAPTINGSRAHQNAAQQHPVAAPLASAYLDNWQPDPMDNANSGIPLPKDDDDDDPEDQLFNLIGNRNRRYSIPPPAPELSGRDSPTLPADSQPEDSLADDDDEDDDDEGIDHSTAGHSESRNPFADLKSAPQDTPFMENTRSIISTTPLLDEDGTGRKFSRSSNFPQQGERSTAREPPPFAPCAGSGSPKAKNSPRSKRPAHSRDGYFRTSGNESAEPPQDQWDAGSQSSATNSADDDWEADSVTGGEKKCGNGEGNQAYTWQRPENRYQGSVSPPPSSSTTTDRRSEFILPPNTYQQQNFGSSSGSQLGPGPFRNGMRPTGMGPLGRQSRAAFPPGSQQYFSAQQQEFLLQQQQLQMKSMEEMYSTGIQAQGFGPPRSSTAPSYIGAPVYAPNPPHSVGARNSGMQVSSPYSNNQGGGSAVGGQSRYGFEQGWPIHPPLIPAQIQHMFSNPNEPRRSFSSESLAWNASDPMAMRNAEPVPIGMPQQGPSPSNSNHENPQNFPPGMWAMANGAMANGFPQPSTPGSQVGMHSHGRSSIPQNWYQQPPVPPIEVSWGGSPLPMMPNQWPGGYSA